MPYKRYLLYIVTISIISLTIVSCGGSGGQGSIDANKTTVVINLGQRDISGAEVSAQAIRYSYIVIRISAPDMETIEEVVDVAGMESVEVKIEVPNGANRHFEVFAYNEFNTLLCYGDTYTDLFGTPVTITVTMVCGADETPPTFGGLISAAAISTTEIDLNWDPATDDVTPSSAIMYLIYMSTTPGGQDFGAPNYTTAPGETTYTVTGLNPLTTYCFVVRAKDEAGNIDSNTEERCATTFIQQYTLMVTRAGTGSGTVTSLPPGIDCGGDCTETYDEGTEVTLTATPDIDSSFAGWSGDPDCADGQVTMNAGKACTATFELQQYTLAVTIAGQGIIGITSNPPGINCTENGGDCSEAYDYGTGVTLNYILNDTFFCGWSGDPDCSDGQVTMDADKTCIANISWQTC